MPAARTTRSSRWGRRPARGTSWRCGCLAWCALTNSNPSAGSSRSPERTRPRLFSRSRALRAASSLHAAADEAPRALRSSDHRLERRRRDPLARPSCESTARSARTSPPAPPAIDPHEPALPAGVETPQGTGVGLGHRELLFPRKGFGVHETGGTSVRREGEPPTPIAQDGYTKVLTCAATTR